jgi:DNA-binding PadR family transcriptional regulator
MPSSPGQFLPLKPVEYLLLLSLGAGERHGYGLVREITERSDGVVQLEPGNLYRVIKRLLADGLIAESGRRNTTESGDERRRFYRLTDLGGRVAAAETRRVSALVASAGAQRLIRRWSER